MAGKGDDTPLPWIGRTAGDHAAILLFGRALDAVAPVNVHALAAVQFEELLGENSHRGGRLHGRHHGHALEVDVVGAVDRLRNTKDGVCRRDAPPQLGVVLDVVDPGKGEKVSAKDKIAEAEALRTGGSRCAAFW